MAEKEKSPTRVTTGKVMLSYVSLFTPYIDPKKPTEKGKYKCLLLIDKKDKDTVAKIKSAIKHVEAKMIAEKYAGKAPKKAISNTLRDGDEEKDEEEYEGKYYMNVWSLRKPPVIDRDKEPITDPDKVYSGCYARVCLNAYYYWGDESKGITFGLEAVQFVSNGPRLGGGSVNIDEAFGDVYEFEDEEEDEYDDL